jgi:hypothetical protein
MPSADTFSVPAIGSFVDRHIRGLGVIVDPFARNGQRATITNDLNPATTAQHHMDAEAFLVMLAKNGTKADAILFDPPYSPRQISECYGEVGMEVGMKETQSSVLYQRVRNAIPDLCHSNTIVLSFGWNSVGMGKKHGFEITEIMLVCHGGAHNDTICMAERRNQWTLAL